MPPRALQRGLERLEQEVPTVAGQLDRRRLQGAVVVTRGERGSQILEKESVRDVAPVQAHAVVDPTGCGDAFRAGLLYGRSRGLELDVACRIGSQLRSGSPRS